MISITMKILPLSGLVAVLVLGTIAASPASEAPHYASIRRDEAFLREGPSYAHRVLWVYRRRSYPLKVIASFDAWRKVKDVDGTSGWMHHTQLSDARSVLVTGKTALRVNGEPNSKIVAFVLPGVVAKLKACKPDFCEVDASGVDGWVGKKNIWGVDAREVF
jgi:SH3-like domain-containing protein